MSALNSWEQPVPRRNTGLARRPSRSLARMASRRGGGEEEEEEEATDAAPARDWLGRRRKPPPPPDAGCFAFPLGAPFRAVRAAHQQRFGGLRSPRVHAHTCCTPTVCVAARRPRL
jgi:hypothetical protein